MASPSAPRSPRGHLRSYEACGISPPIGGGAQIKHYDIGIVVVRGLEGIPLLRDHLHNEVLLLEVTGDHSGEESVVVDDQGTNSAGRRSADGA